jgi:transmembrane sensor
MKVSSPGEPLPAAMETAADWLVRLHSGEATAEDRLAIRRWCDQHPDHARAWARAQQFLRHFERIPPDIGRAALDAPASPSRRRALNQLALLLAAGPVTWAAWHHTPWREWSADYRTGTGEQRQLALEDGSRVMLNTDTAIEVAFDATQRHIRLITGELFATVARDDPRPLRVENRHGIAQAFDAAFSLRQFEQRSRAAVFTGEVAVSPLSAPERMQRLTAGQQIHFDATSTTPAEAATPLGQSWTQGMLIARQMRLADLLAELARYRPGLLRCDPAVADLRISGAFPVTDIALSLKMLGDTFPVRVHSVTRYWTTVGPIG